MVFSSFVFQMCIVDMTGPDFLKKKNDLADNLREPNPFSIRHLAGFMQKNEE